MAKRRAVPDATATCQTERISFEVFKRISFSLSFSYKFGRVPFAVSSN